jgi:integrase
MSETEFSSGVNIKKEQKKAAWTTAGPLNGKTRQLRTIISSSQATANPNNNQEEKGSAVKGIDERINSDGSVSYRARVRVKGHAPITKTFSSLTLAKKWKKTTEVEIEKGRYFDKHEAQKHTMGEAIDRYIQTVLPKKPKNARNVKQHLLWWKKHLKPLTLDAVKPSLIAEKRDLLLSESNDYGRRRSTTTAVRYLSSLSHLFTIAIKEWEWLSENPIHKISKPRLANGRVRFLNDDERIRLLEACRQSRCKVLYLAVILALSTGMRYGEILNLTRADVDIENGVITLKETKNGEVRSLPLVGQPLELLKLHVASINKPSALIFPSPSSPTKPIDIRSAWEKALQNAHITNFRFHDLRHTTASYLAMNGHSLLDIAALLGHKDLQMTKRYAHLSQEYKKGMVTTMTQKILSE